MRRRAREVQQAGVRNRLFRRYGSCAACSTPVVSPDCQDDYYLTRCRCTAVALLRCECKGLGHAHSPWGELTVQDVIGKKR